MLDLVPNDDLCAAESFSDFLKARLKRLSMPQEKLARDTGCAVSDVRGWVAGTALPAADRLWCLGEVLDIEPADLLWALALGLVLAPVVPQPAPKAELPSLPPLPQLPSFSFTKEDSPVVMLAPPAATKIVGAPSNGRDEKIARFLAEDEDSDSDEDSDEDEDSDDEIDDAEDNDKEDEK